MAGLYIHIPFCESRCIYCGFYSTTSLKLRDEYIDALRKEMTLRPLSLELGKDEGINTIYLGGGTPSQLSSSQLLRLFEAISNYGITPKSHPEITMECNPDDITPEFCETLKQLPINRISMGAQTFSDTRLHFLHRRHNAEEVRLAIQRLRAIGIHNISIDLMFGFPNETLEEWKNDIREAVRLGVEHISAYSLMYEEGTALYKMLEQGKIQEIDEEVSCQMFETLCDMLIEAGYEHYEISNFAKPGYRSRHNSSYWHEIPYIGIGAAAHSYKRFPLSAAPKAQPTETQVTRSWNVASLQTYITSIQRGILPSESEQLNLSTRYNDLITTALRTSDGINLAKMKEEFGESFLQRLLQEADDKIKRGLMEITSKKIIENKSHHEQEEKVLRLTRKGIYISDDIMGDFMIVD